MKNNLKNKFLFLLLLCFAIFTSYAGPFKFTLEPNLGIRNGVLTEHVFAKNSQNGSDYTLSLLEWDLKGAAYFGINSELGIKDFYIDLGFKYFTSLRVGKMTDSDWAQDEIYKTGNTSLQTNLSKHDNTLRTGVNLDLLFKYKFNINCFSITPNIGASLEYYKFESHNGWYQYGHSKDTGTASYYAYNDSVHSTYSNFHGNAINLNRYDFYIWTGFDIGANLLNDKLLLSCGIAIAPYTLLIAEDTHIQRSLYFLDRTQGAFKALRWNVFMQYKPIDFFGLKLSLSGLNTQVLRGQGGVSESSDGPYNSTGNDTAGASTNYFDVNFSVLFAW